MLLFFDYVFYRAYKAAISKSEIPLTYASGIVTVIQSFAFLTLFSIGRYFFDFSPINKFVFGLIFILIFAANWYRYERNPWLDEMKEKWEDEDVNTKLIRGWLIVIGLALLLVLPFYISGLIYDRNHSGM